MTHEEKIEKAISIAYWKRQISDEIVNQLPSPGELAVGIVVVGGILAGLGIAAGAVASTGVGAILEGIAAGIVLGLAAVGIFTSGRQIMAGISVLLKFFEATSTAQTCDDLALAGKDFAKGVAEVGVGTVMMVLSVLGARRGLRVGKGAMGRWGSRTDTQLEAPPATSKAVTEEPVTQGTEPIAERTLTAEQANAGHIKAGRRPPYAPNSTVTERVLPRNEHYVRVHGDSNKAGTWIMKQSEIEGLTADQIQDKFALPEKPKYISDVNVPAGSTLRSGSVGMQVGWGNGGGTQGELIGRIPNDSFTNTRPLQ